MIFLRCSTPQVTNALKDAVVKHLINFEPAEYGAIASAFARLDFFPGSAFNELVRGGRGKGGGRGRGRGRGKDELEGQGQGQG